jgi:hypothetical protein
MADKILLGIINQHLPYEIDMLRSTYLQLARISTVDPKTETNEQKALRFTFIESFCIHARSLLDFFSNNPGRWRDATAKEFTTGFAPIDPSKDPLSTIRTKINKQIFHLTKDRTLLETEQFDAGNDGAKVLQSVELAIVQFTACLTPDFRQFKCNTKPVPLSSLLAFGSSTCSFTSMVWTANLANT